MPISKMQLVEKFYRRPLRIFDVLNRRAVFRQFVAKVFADARALPETGCFRSEQNSVYECVENELIRGAAIDYLEFGVHEGKTIEKWTALNTNPESRFYGFDSFEGLPTDWISLWRSLPKGTFSTGGQLPAIADPRVIFVKGLFHKSLPDFLARFQSAHRLVVNIDSDLYASALYVLATLDRWLVPGAIVIFDEFPDLLNEFPAWRDYCAAFWREAQGICFAPNYRKVALLMR